MAFDIFGNGGDGFLSNEHGIDSMDSTHHQADAGNQFQTHANNLGGHDFFQGSHQVAHSNSNIFGGHDVRGNDGHLISSSKTNVFGGHDIHDQNGLHSTTKTNVFGGHNIYDSHNQLAGHTKPNIFGGHDVFDAHNTKIASSQPNIFSGANIKFK